MCGLVGLYSPHGLPGGIGLDDAIGRMTNSLLHRGPDSGGVWTDPNANIALGHRRLAILDLSPEGHQPMVSDDGRYVMVFNGEIYNFAQLQHDLANEGQHFRGRSDTEVLLAAIARWGLKRALEAAAGMFALAVWDRSARILHLARDRLGKKPLYFGRVGRGFAFASELKAFTIIPGFARNIDRAALTLFLRRQYVPAPATIWQGVLKLPAGTQLQIRLDGAIPDLGHLTGAIRPFWSARDVAVAQAEDALTDEVEALAALDGLLASAVGERMVADVPLGAFLSGGIDSSLVVALMQAQSTRPIKTFTVSFAESGYDEAAEAREVARRLGTDHTEIRVTPAQAREIIPSLPLIYDEPFADASQIPTWHVAHLARGAVTVALSGDGGDEVFGGYGRYLLAAGLERRMRRVPLRLRQAAAAAVRAVPAGGWDGVLRLVRTRLPQGYRGEMTGDRLQKLAKLIAAEDSAALYRAVLDVGAADVLLSKEHSWLGASTSGKIEPRLADFVHEMMCHDTMTYLPDDVLAKVDRASMAVSLEVRSPILDHRVVEFAWRLPLSMKVRSGQGKWPLRELLERRLPGGPAMRAKQGFGVPIADWLRGPLRAWGEELLASRRIAEEGMFDAPAVRKLWNSHLSGRHNWAPALWTVLMFQAWRECWSGDSLSAGLAPAA